MRPPDVWFQFYIQNFYFAHTHTHTSLTALFPGLPGWAGTRKAKPIWILLKQETVSGCGISWAICKSAPHSRQITTPAPHHSVFYRPDALPAAQPTVSKHWRPLFRTKVHHYQWLMILITYLLSTPANILILEKCTESTVMLAFWRKLYMYFQFSWTHIQQVCNRAKDKWCKWVYIWS